MKFTNETVAISWNEKTRKVEVESKLFPRLFQNWVSSVFFREKKRKLLKGQKEQNIFHHFMSLPKTENLRNV
jgi:hypothetical protein